MAYSCQNLCIYVADLLGSILQQTMPQLIVGLLNPCCTTGIGLCNLLKLLLDRTGRHAPKTSGDVGVLAALLYVSLGASVMDAGYLRKPSRVQLSSQRGSSSAVAAAATGALR